MKKNKMIKIFLWIVIFAVVASLIPVLWISLYNHPSADDFAYAAETHMVWKSTRNLFLVLKEAVLTSVGYWKRWQGLYSSAFLLALEPGIFGEQYYGITGWITTGTLLVSNLVFSIYLLNQRLGINRLTAGAFGMINTFLMVHWMPSAMEGLFWYNGAMNYTFFFGILLIFLCAVLDLCKEQENKRLVTHLIIGAILAFVLSGGNHVTACIGLLLVTSIWITCFVMKKRHYVKRVSIVLGIEILGFMLNILAPGTKVRADAMEESKGIFWTIWNVAQYLLERIDRWLGLALVVCIVLMLPFMFQCVRKIRKEIGFRFQRPLLVFVLSVGVLAASCCPSYYVMGTIGAGRLVNIVYFLFVIVVMINALYVCGWIDGKLCMKEFHWSIQWLMVCMVLTFGMILGCYGDSTGYLAWKTINKGEALAYSLEADARYNLYIQSEGQDVEVPAFTSYPKLLFNEDITENPEDWKNLQVEEYYQLNSVVIK